MSTSNPESLVPRRATYRNRHLHVAVSPCRKPSSCWHRSCELIHRLTLRHCMCKEQLTGKVCSELLGHYMCSHVSDRCSVALSPTETHMYANESMRRASESQAILSELLLPPKSTPGRNVWKYLIRSLRRRNVWNNAHVKLKKQ